MLTPFIKTNVQVVNKKTHEPTDWDYYIGRPSPLGNPYTHLKTSRVAEIFVPTRDEAIQSYESYFYDKINSGDKEFISELDEIMGIYKEYGRINLMCWCVPKPCHGHYIKEYIENKLKDKPVIERDGSHVHLNMGDTNKLSKDFKISGTK